MKTTFIYCLIDPRDNQIRYVGKSNNPKERLKNHCNPARYRPTYKFNWIKKLRQLELKPILKILEEVDIEIWKQKEKYWIDFYKSEGFNLVNYTDGGDGLSFGNQTSFKIGNVPWNKNKQRLQKTKNKISNSLKGLKNKPLVSVIQYTINDEYLNEYGSITEAAKVTNSSISKICLVCQGKRKTHNNFKWKYK